MINSFRGKHEFLSNFYPAKIELFGRTFTCSEAAYQAMKCWERAGEFENINGAAAKRLGGQVKIEESTPNCTTVPVLGNRCS